MNKKLLISIVNCLLFSVFAQVSYGRSQVDPCRFIPPGWTPFLEQVGESLEETAKQDYPKEESAEPSQLKLNLVSQNIADLRDAELFIAYVQLAQTFNSHKQHEFCVEQKRWLEKRTAETDAAAGSTHGSITASETSNAFRKITEERLAELRKRLSQSGKTTIPKLKK